MQCLYCGFNNQEGIRFCGGCGQSLNSSEDALEAATERDNVFGSFEFVGRKRELKVLTTSLEDSLKGRGRIIMLAGEPGIGKTRLAQELALNAESRGATVLWGRCYEEQGVPPYWPWVQMLRSYIQQANPELLRSEMGAGAADVADLVPELRERFPDIEPLHQIEPAQAKFRLFDSITNFLKNISHSHPLALMLEDLHWADTSSLQLLEFVGREIAESRMLLLGTYRDTEVSRHHPLSQTLGGLVHVSVSGAFQRVPLRGLTRQDVGNFVEISTGIDRNADMVEAVFSRTEGNPLFLGEVVRMIGQGEADSGMSLPEGIREAIGRRLDRLSDECNQVLTVASVVGRKFSLGTVAHLNEDISENRLLQILDEALDAGIIDELPGSPESYQFTHALIHETLLSELSAARRVRFHARIAEALEKMYEFDVKAHSSELARHFSEASLVLGTEKLVMYSSMAGEQSLSTYAWEDARDHFETALVAKQDQPMDDEKAQLLFGLAQARHSLYERGDTIRAVEVVVPAFDHYLESGNASKALAIAEYPFRAMAGYQSELENLIGRAVNLASAESIQQGYLLSRHGAVLYSERGDADEAQKSFEKAMSIALQNHDVMLEMQVINEMTRFYEAQHRFKESLDSALRVIELSTRIDTPLYDPNPHIKAVNSYIALGDLDSAEPHAAAFLRYTERFPTTSDRTYSFLLNNLIAYLKGSYSEAIQFNDKGLSYSPRDCRILYSRTLIEYQLGHFSRGEEFLEQLLDVMRSTPPSPTLEYAFVPPVIAMVSLITGDSSRFDMLNSIIEVLSAPQAVSHASWYLPIALAIIAIQRGDTDDALKYYSLLKSHPHPMNGGPWAMISIDRLLGLLSATTRDFDISATHLEDALATCKKGGYRPELAWTCHDYVKTLLQRKGTGDNEKALSLLNEGLEISIELGMRPLIEKLTALKEEIDSRPSAPRYPRGLTEREVEVLRLAAQGKTNREIASELFISVRTVQNHVRNIYNKIDARNRAEATAFAINQLG